VTSDVPRHSASASKDADGDDDYVWKEWQAAQDDLLKFDDYLHDIRKYGFSFVTGLLTVDVLFGQEDPEFKLAALIGTMALIVVLFVIDRNYRVFNAAANIRATLLERRSPAELSQTITRLYESQRVGGAFTFVYLGLVSVTFVIGYFVLEPSLHLFLGAALAIAFVAMAVLHFTLGIRPWVYVDIDGFTYKKKESVLVIVSHVRGKAKGPKPRILGGEVSPLKLEASKRVWDVYREEDTLMDDAVALGSEWEDEKKDPRKPKKDISISENFEHRWEFPAAHLDPGLYRVVYHGPRYRKVRAFSYELSPKPDKEEGDERKERWNIAPRFRIVS
jgi:hypothetical protein